MTFYTSLSGLQASQTEMATISHNLANVSTNGFKKSRVEFADVMASNVSVSPTQMVGSGTVVKAVRQQFSQGGSQQSTNSLDMLISGEGFFAVKPDLNSAKVSFTRNGAFFVDNDRFVTDANGGKLQVYPVDGSGTVVATGLDSMVSLRLPATSGVPSATKKIDLSINLSANASIPKDSTLFAAGTGKTYAFDRFNPSTYNNSSQTTIYDALGNAQTMTNYYVRDTASTGPGTTSTWKVYTFVGSEQLTSGSGKDPMTMTFDDKGKLQSVAAGNGTVSTPSSFVAFDFFTPASSTTPQGLSIDFGSMTTQLSSPFVKSAEVQDGRAIGQIESVTISEYGVVSASFSNGDTQPLGKVALANFSNPSGLRQLGKSYWSATGVSGEARLGEAGANGFGNLSTGAIERSNVDITEELVSLIAAQRNFQANAKSLETSSQISQTIFNMRS
ncbi:flagellar hook protein FlgE [uncultured Sphingomonas sp.]|uniref:flagellar hook protein FlgE n=1 Tax=uncultured Sphingomonas sp. TaxID=158754 RepID=UPI0025CD25A8|nr:flagellar hook protein FlgE [uncultured Sphingomonas sp.]